MSICRVGEAPFTRKPTKVIRGPFLSKLDDLPLIYSRDFWWVTLRLRRYAAPTLQTYNLNTKTIFQDTK